MQIEGNSEQTEETTDTHQGIWREFWPVVAIIIFGILATGAIFFHKMELVKL